MSESASSQKFLTQLEDFGIHAKSIHRNLPVENLLDISTQKNDGVLTALGSLSVKTGKYTGRSTQDRYIIYDEETHDTIDWGNVNRRFPSEKFNQIFEKWRILYNLDQESKSIFKMERPTSKISFDKRLSYRI